MTYAGHGNRTQRDSLHVVATSNPNDLDAVVKRWIAIADKAGADADQVKAKLSALVTVGGWMGTGADAYAHSVEVEIIQPLLKIEAAARALATSLLGVQQKVEDAAEAAQTLHVPWDADTRRHVEQKKLSVMDYLIGTLVDGTLIVDPVSTLQHYNSAQANSDYKIKTGSGHVVKTISAASWTATQRESKPMPPAGLGGMGGPSSKNGKGNNLKITGIAGTGPALMGGRNVRKKDHSEAEGDQTWLEEDQDVWGTSGTRVDGIR